MIRTTFALLTVACFAATLPAETILKFDLGTAGADFELQSGTLSTIDDGNAATFGDQNTNINFTGFLAGMTDIMADVASFSLDGIMLSGPASVIGGAVAVQPTSGGQFNLWDDLNQLLLAGTLTDGSITGSLGHSAAGSFFNLNLDTFTGGSLASLVDEDSLSLSISLTDTNNGAGFSVANDLLQSFTAAGTGNIAAAVPEPAGVTLAMCGCLGILGLRRRR